MLGDPTLGGYLLFIRNVMGVPISALADDSPSVSYSYNAALRVVNPAIRSMVVPGLSLYDGYDPAFPSQYARAVYNLAGDRLMNYAPDDPTGPIIDGSNPPLRYFAYTRQQLNLLGFTSGVVQSTSDEGTSVSMVVPEALSQLTMRDLSTLKTPWGREYMAIVQDYGPTGWGLS